MGIDSCGLAVRFAPQFTETMNKLVLLILGLSPAVLSAQNRSVSLGPSYGNDVFYSLDSGVVGTAPASNWDLAFAVDAFDVTVRINDGKGLRLYDLQTALTDWSTADTAGKMTTPLANSEHEWTLGAFNYGATGHPNYGWGTYNQITHDVIGTKVYALRWADGSVKKVAIEAMAANGTVTVRVANLDGSGLQTITTSKGSYAGKKFGYIDLLNATSLDREPLAGRYDLIFGKYVALLPGNVLYPVTGVRTKAGVLSAKARNVDTNSVDPSLYLLQDTSAASIGYDWKSFAMSTFSWILADSTAYLVQPSVSSPIYQIVFKTFGGSSTGEVGFSQRIVSALSAPELAQSKVLIYPNPGHETLNLSIESNSEVRLLDLHGRLVRTWYAAAGTNSWSVADVPTGTYLIEVSNGLQSATLRWQCF